MGGASTEGQAANETTTRVAQKAKSPWIAPRAGDREFPSAAAPRGAAIMPNFLPISQHRVGYLGAPELEGGRNSIKCGVPKPISEGQVLTPQMPAAVVSVCGSRGGSISIDPGTGPADR